MSDPLESWKAGPAKSAILDFVDRVTRLDSADYVRPADRISVFDNDGTLWCEQPLQVQVLFAQDRLKELAERHPELRSKQPFKAFLEHDLKTIHDLGKRGVFGVALMVHAGMTEADFADIASTWLASATHPTLARPFTQCVFQPQLELLSYLRDHGFKTFIVSGGGAEFMRVFAEKVYGIPPQQVIGSTIKLKYELQGDKPVLRRQPEIDFIDDKAGKPVGIQKFIGRRPVFAAGNSDGDYEMLRWVTAGAGPRLGVIVHHTDAKREYAYDRDSHVGRLDRGLKEADDRGWKLIDMQRDWSAVFPTPGK